MTSIFAAADALSSAAVSRVMGVRLLHIPRTPGGDFTEGGIDETREPTLFVGVLSGAIGTQNLKGDAAGEGFQATMTTREQMVSADRSDWPALARKGDHVQALDEPGAPIFEITSIVPDRMSRVIVNLVVVS